MTETTWKIIVHVFGDKTFRPETFLFGVDFGGDYKLGANSNTVPGAQETRFSFTHKLVTPTAAGVDFLKPRCDQYAWAPGTVQDIAKDGCGKLFVSIDACPVEYDLTAIVNRRLRLGDRSHPLCALDTRPVKLQGLASSGNSSEHVRTPPHFLDQRCYRGVYRYKLSVTVSPKL